MKQFASLLIAILGMAGGAWGQSLLEAVPQGAPSVSPYDPPRPRAMKRHDHVEILFRSVQGATPEFLVAVTAEVADVRPNGTVVLQAIRKCKVNGEDDSVTLTAEAAPQSIVGGKVRLDQLANLHLVRESGGRR